MSLRGGEARDSMSLTVSHLCGWNSSFHPFLMELVFISCYLKVTLNNACSSKWFVQRIFLRSTSCARYFTKGPSFPYVGHSWVVGVLLQEPTSKHLDDVQSVQDQGFFFSHWWEFFRCWGAVRDLEKSQCPSARSSVQTLTIASLEKHTRTERTSQLTWDSCDIKNKHVLSRNVRQGTELTSSTCIRLNEGLRHSLKITPAKLSTSK